MIRGVALDPFDIEQILIGHQNWMKEMHTCPSK
jgi:hypothetical protein